MAVKRIISCYLAMISILCMMFVGTVNVEATTNKLPAPENIKASVSCDKIVLTWDEVDNADAYRVYMYDSVTKKYEKYKNVSNAKCNIKSLEKNTTYYFKIAALIKKDGKFVVQTKTNRIKLKTKNEPTAPSSNYTGFYEYGDNTYYFSNGKIVNGMKKIDGDYYYFGINGMITGWLNKREIYYYFDKDGKMVINKTLKINGNKYVFGEDGAVEWYINTVEPTKNVYYVGGYKKPEISVWTSSKVDSKCYVVCIGIDNEGDKKVVIHTFAHLEDRDYESYDRTLSQINREAQFIDTYTIDAGDYESVFFGVLGDATWYDKKTKITFYFVYDNVSYICTTSNYYGTTIKPAHFDLD